LLSVNFNVVDSNIVWANGSSTNNYGVYLATNVNWNNVTNNTVNTSGTSGGVGVAISGATSPAVGNLVANNTVMASGTTTGNFGVYLLTNVSQSNVSCNVIVTNGTTTNYGIYLVGIANAPVNLNEVSDNSVRTMCSSANSQCHGIFLQNLVNQNNILSNNVITGVTTANYGVYLLGSAVLPVSFNLLDSNVLNVSNAIRIILNTAVLNTTLRNNSIVGRNYAYNDINFSAAGLNDTLFVDQYLENYTFAGVGGNLTVRDSTDGEVAFPGLVNGTGANFSKDIQISNNLILINSTRIGLNKTARLSLYGLSFVNPLILKNNANCVDCVISSYSGGTIIFNISSSGQYSANETPDTVYPIFSALWDNSGTFIDTGIGLFNVTVDNTNGTVLLEINNTNITATNVSGNVYNVSYYLTPNGTYSYKWHSWGNGTLHNHNASASSNYVVNTNYTLSLDYITPIGAIDPVDSSVKIVSVNFTINDKSGNFTINTSSTKIFANNSAVSRNTSNCLSYAINSSAVNISCNLSMQYYDSPGVWSINISIRDNDNNYIENFTTFTYNELSAVQININSLNVGIVNISQQDVELTPVIVNNTGNSIFTNLSIKAVDLINSTYMIPANSFSINVTNAVTGMTLVNNTLINIPNSSLGRNNDTNITNVNLYIYLDVPSAPLIAGYYASSSEWMIVANK